MYVYVFLIAHFYGICSGCPKSSPNSQFEFRLAIWYRNIVIQTATKNKQIETLLSLFAAYEFLSPFTFAFASSLCNK